MNDITINPMFEPIKDRLVQLLPPETVMKECSFALQLFSKNEYLNKCSQESKQQAVLNVAQIGLTLNPVLKHAYLVPRYNAQKKIVECCLEPSYIGLAKMVTDTGSARSISAQVVYEGDEFDVSLGTECRIIHKPRFKTKQIKLVYAVAVLSDGSNMVEVMTTDDIDEIKTRSESFKAFKAGKVSSCVWATDYAEMSRKTVIRRIVKYLPKTEMWDKLATAIELDEQDYGASYDQQDYVNTLLNTANIAEEESALIYREINTMSSDRAHELIEYLKENQVDPITSGLNYGQGDIKGKIKLEI